MSSELTMSCMNPFEEQVRSLAKERETADQGPGNGVSDPGKEA